MDKPELPPLSERDYVMTPEEIAEWTAAELAHDIAKDEGSYPGCGACDECDAGIQCRDFPRLDPS